LHRPLLEVAVEHTLIIWIQADFKLFQLDEFLDGFGKIRRIKVIF